MKLPILLSLAILSVVSVGCAVQPSPDADVQQSELAHAGPVGRRAYAALRDVAPKVTLSILGEDDGTPCTASLRTGPVGRLTAENALKLLGFNVDRQLASDTFSFQPHDPRDAELWDGFVDGQDDAEAAKK